MDCLEPAHSFATGMPTEGAIVLRSFGKMFGLAGLRLGFAIGGPGVIAEVRAALGPWPVSGPAIAIGTRALADTAWQQRMRGVLRAEAGRLDALLLRAGFAIAGGTSLFRLAKHGDAGTWYQRLGEAGILVRPFPSHPHWLRFGLPAEEPAWEPPGAGLALTAPVPDAPALRRGWTTGTCATAASRQPSRPCSAASPRTPFRSPCQAERAPASPRAARTRPGFRPRRRRQGRRRRSRRDARRPDPGHPPLRRAGSGISFRAGPGVGMVTLPGLPLPPGEPAINPAPRRMIRAALLEVAAASNAPDDLVVEIGVETANALPSAP